MKFYYSKLSLIGLILFGPLTAWTQVPNVKIEYSYGLDMYCAGRVVPEVLTREQLKLIPKIPTYREELLAKLPLFQAEWNKQGVPLLKQTRALIGKPFPMTDIQAGVFLCPRLPFMGTPLIFNIISYLDSSAKDIKGLNGNPMPMFFFISTAFHEILHKYIDDILEKRPSVLLKDMKDTDLYKAHLHLFAVQKLVFDSLGLSALLLQIQGVEAMHGKDYVKAWDSVHKNPDLYRKLIAELTL